MVVIWYIYLYTTATDGSGPPKQVFFFIKVFMFIFWSGWIEKDYFSRTCLASLILDAMYGDPPLSGWLAIMIRRWASLILVFAIVSLVFIYLFIGKAIGNAL